MGSPSTGSTTESSKRQGRRNIRGEVEAEGKGARKVGGFRGLYQLHFERSNNSPCRPFISGTSHPAYVCGAYLYCLQLILDYYRGTSQFCENSLLQLLTVFTASERAIPHPNTQKRTRPIHSARGKLFRELLQATTSPIRTPGNKPALLWNQYATAHQLPSGAIQRNGDPQQQSRLHLTILDSP